MLTPQHILSLQRTAGNAATTALVTRSRAAAPVIQRFFDPATAETDARNHLTTRGQAIIQAFLASERSVTGQSNLDDNTLLAVPPRTVHASLREMVADNLNSLLAGNGLHASATAAPDVAELVMVCNAMEEATSARTVANATTGAHALDSVHFGTEFTFTNTVLHGLRVLAPGEDTKTAKAQEKPRQVAAGMMAEWERSVRGQRKAAVAITLVKGDDVKAEKGAYRFTYAGSGGWWWQLDIDDSCLETQTMPSSQTTLAGVREIIEKDIFATAGTLGLAPDSTNISGGGGHISVDVRGAFGESVAALIEALVHLQSNAEQWKTAVHGSNVAKGYDRVNSPWLSDVMHGGSSQSSSSSQSSQSSSSSKKEEKSVARTGLQAFSDLANRLIVRAKQGEIGLVRAQTELAAFYKELINPAHKNLPLAQAKDVNAAASHYQAVNTEHVAEPGGRARLELRDVPAQSDYTRLMADLNLVKAHLNTARAASQSKTYG